MKRLGRILVLFVAFLLLLLLIGPLVIPVPPLKGTVPAEQLADPDSLFVEVDGLTVHYKRAGQGEPLFILLHGFGASLFSWREVMAPLSQSGTVIAFDRPAFGLTERPMPGEWQGESPYSAAAQVDLTLALMDTLDVPEAILVGNSAGGTIAMLTALRAPQRVQALILVSPAVYGGGGAPSWVRFLSGLPQVRRAGPLLVRSLVTQLEGALPSAWHDPGEITPEVLAGYKKPLLVENWDRAFLEFVLAGRRQDLEQHLDRFTLPVLVVTGDDDRWVPTVQSVRLSDELPNARLVVIPDCGHLAHEEAPQEFMAAVYDFMEEQ